MTRPRTPASERMMAIPSIVATSAADVFSRNGIARQGGTASSDRRWCQPWIGRSGGSPAAGEPVNGASGDKDGKVLGARASASRWARASATTCSTAARSWVPLDLSVSVATTCARCLRSASFSVIRCRPFHRGPAARRPGSPLTGTAASRWGGIGGIGWCVVTSCNGG